MASTYSTNLAIELIGTGDQAGSWGTTTNSNLGTLIEQSISGYVTQAVATGTDTTITIPNGSSGVARNMYIELTGTGGASTNLVVPANKKLYFIFNNSTGAVTVKVSGQTGVSVPTGKKMVLVSNGTDIVNGLNYIADFASNSATITHLSATSATITNLTLTSLVISNLSIASANITTLSGTTATFTSGTITNLNSTSANITTLTGTTFGTTATTQLRGASGQITTLTSTSANITTLTGSSANITQLQSTSATITTLTGSSANITTLSGTTATFTSGTVTNLALTSLTISNLSIASANITTLTGTTFGTTATTQLRGASAQITTLTTTSADITTLTGTTFGTTATTQLRGASAQITTLTTTSANITTLTGTNATFTSGTISNLNSTSANITTLTGTTFGTTAATQLRGASAQITTLTTTSADITTLTGTTFGTTATTQLRGASANITTLSGTTATFTSATVTNLALTSLTISNLSIASANITTLTGTTFGTTATTQLRGLSANITTLTSASATITNLLATSLAVSSVATFTANPVLSGGTANGVLYLNGSKVATSGTALVFDGTNLGIGTSSPVAKVDARITSDGNVGYFRRVGGTINPGITVFANETGNTVGFDTVYSTSSPAYKFRVGGLDIMTLDASGSLGLGVTPSTKLDLKQSTDNAFSGVRIERSATATQYSVLSSAQGTTYLVGVDTANAGNNVLSFGNSGNGSTYNERARISAAGGFSVGTTTDPGAGNIGLAAGKDLRYSSTSYITPEDNVSGARISSAGVVSFWTGATPAERARITAGGYSKFSDSGSYDSATGAYHELRQTANSTGVLCSSTAASFTASNIISGIYGTVAGTGFRHFDCLNSTAASVFFVRGDGNAYNTNGTYGTISDARLKQDIADAPSQWGDIKAIQFRKYRMKADVDVNPDAPELLGVVAQELEQTSPGLVDEGSDGIKSVKSSILLMKAAVALQEAMTRIEQLEAKVAALESK